MWGRFRWMKALALRPQAALRPVLRRSTGTPCPSPCVALKLSQRSVVVVGNSDYMVRSAEAFTTVRSDLFGMRDSSRSRVHAGDVFGLMDIAGANTAMTFIDGEETEGWCDLEAGRAVSTVAFNSFMFKQPVFTGDLLIVTSTVVSAGQSSVGLHLQLSRQGYDTPKPSNVGQCYMTMVCIDFNTLRPLRGVVPAVSLQSEENIDRNKVYTSIRDSQRATAQRVLEMGATVITHEAIEDEENRKKPEKVRMSDTTTTATRTYTQTYRNPNNTIFGGEILRWMAHHATHCGRVFARSLHVYVVGMHDMIFDSPIFPSDFVRLSAKVVYVRRTTMEVDVKLEVRRKGVLVTTNRASYVLIQMGPDDEKKELRYGLDLTNETQENLLQYATAKFRYDQTLKRRREQSRERPTAPQ